MSAKSPFSSQPRLTTLLGGTLEATLHELLYVRRIYPRDSFAPNRFLGVSCHASRHPGVVDYIYGFLDVAVPALCAGTADELALVVVDSPPGRLEMILERFVFAFDTTEMNDRIREVLGGRDHEKKVADMVRYLEPRLRDILLQVVSMNGLDVRRPSTRNRTDVDIRNGPSSDPSSNMTFKLVLRIAPSNKEGDTTEVILPTDCAELDTAMKEARWFQSQADSCAFSGGPIPGKMPQEITRTLKSMRAPSVGMGITLNMEIDPSD